MAAVEKTNRYEWQAFHCAKVGKIIWIEGVSFYAVVRRNLFPNQLHSLHLIHYLCIQDKQYYATNQNQLSNPPSII
jgi:hypothetical protein